MKNNLPTHHEFSQISQTASKKQWSLPQLMLISHDDIMLPKVQPGAAETSGFFSTVNGAGNSYVFS